MTTLTRPLARPPGRGTEEDLPAVPISGRSACAAGRRLKRGNVTRCRGRLKFRVATVPVNPLAFSLALGLHPLCQSRCCFVLVAWAPASQQWSCQKRAHSRIQRFNASLTSRQPRSVGRPHHSDGAACQYIRVTLEYRMAHFPVLVNPSLI